MYQNKRNALQRARLSTGLTQEALAERSGYSPDSIRAWESGARLASLEALGILSEVLGAAWLPGVYLREQSSALNDLLPDFEVGRPLAEAAAEYVTCLLDLVESRVDRQLLRMVADGRIDEVERPVFEEIMEAAGRANRAYYEMRFAARKDHQQ
ncbi:MAG: helix-turn-helix transcriptional regulator [Oscillospiraceae bacterium]|jgi:transcriptional regulator with XRE-family HTH domain|nr:helix-turn-helix transcriptional regulator [Oscillospiraceae bacterium]